MAGKAPVIEIKKTDLDKIQKKAEKLSNAIAKIAESAEELNEEIEEVLKS